LRDYSLGIKLRSSEANSISLLYVSDCVEKKVNIINYFQIENNRVIDLIDVSFLCQLHFYISRDCFLKIINDHDKIISLDVSLNKFLIKYDLEEWLI
jgi:hypothetical protein